MKNKTVGIYTLGCRVNQYESCAISEMLEALGFEATGKNTQCDYYIVNTCAVTAESERKSRQLVRRCAAKGKVFVIGCASQISADFFDIENVVYVGGCRDKSAVVEALTKYDSENSENVINNVTSMDNAPYEELNLSSAEHLFSECRAFIKIQDGCNGKCSYCIIPKCRGKVRSRSAEEIIAEAERLVKCGYQEIILTGIEVGAYNKIPLGELIKRLSKVEGLKRLRLGSLSPNIITEQFMKDVSGCECFMPHIHLSLQSCNDRVLKLMCRPYRKQDIFDRVSLIRSYIPNCSISADIIVGFPTETEAEFEETALALTELKVFHVHSFPYSERKGTPAATMEGSIPKHIRTERNARLIALCNGVKERIIESYKGNTTSVLIEKIENGRAIGHCNEFIEAQFIAEDANIGDIIEIFIDSYNGARIEGRVVKTEEQYE
ncbi:MAG: tRNA (N(6)-L-threonylcarbamoyladenosine(37)-C(2))-methylthiotransferase MtaB [Clostridia bacterium]|nr:tRNA (N(6)-L-threonylcarbamoyladenosine(37)-C(2))-methylthiotransferase MtaB [Clostridia bacterium]